MYITILTMPTGLMLTWETSKCQVDICNFDNMFFNQKDCGTPMCTKFAVLPCNKDQNFVYKFLRRAVLIGFALTS